MATTIKEEKLPDLEEESRGNQLCQEKSTGQYFGVMFQCGKTQVARIIKNQDSPLSMYESNASGSKVHATSIFRSSEFRDVNKALYEW